MNKGIRILIILTMLSGCAYTFPKVKEQRKEERKIVYVEKTFKQNMWDLGRTVLGAAITGIFFSVAFDKQGEELEKAFGGKGR